MLVVFFFSSRRQHTRLSGDWSSDVCSSDLQGVAAILSVPLGLVVGSFLNVCIWRIPRDESIAWPGSHCPQCDGSIAWYDNIPLISFVWLAGRCRHCKAL